MPRAPVVDRDSFPAMKSNERRKRKLLAARETARVLEAREDARAETLVRLGKSANRYEGSTPHEVDGAHTFAPRVLQTRMSAHEGSTRRSGRKGTLKFVPARHDAGAPKHGGARLPAGQWLDRATGEPRVASTSAIASTSTIARRDAMRLGTGPVTVLHGDDDAPLPESTDPGDHELTTLERAYWARVHNPEGIV
jgi:hypothetical protein